MGIQTNVPGAPVSSAELEKVGGAELGIADKLLEKQPTVTGLVSTDDFFKATTEIFSSLAHQRNVVARLNDRNEHTTARIMAKRVYTGRNIALPYSGKTFTKWSQDKGFDLSKLTKDDHRNLIVTIFNKITGADNNTALSIADVQAAMMSAMQSINSYSVQYLFEANDGSYLKTDHTVLRTANIRAAVTDSLFSNVSLLNKVALHEKGHALLSATISKIGVTSIQQRGLYPLSVELPVLEFKMRPSAPQPLSANFSGIKALNKF